MPHLEPGRRCRPAGYEKSHFLSSTYPRVPHPPGFPVRPGGGNELHAAFLIESRTRRHGWGRAVGNPGSFAFFEKGGIPRISIPTVAYPTLCKERKGWGTRLFVVLPAVPNTNLRLIENLFLISTSRSKSCPQGLKALKYMYRSVLAGLKTRSPD